ncbi:biotin/lipoyl-binding protein [Neorhodopirellula pilleata]|uniref:Peptidase family M50 n=1 Tax=Neorhodopirellula pilleata TaxID=2714738 RepID=A0A5C6APE3_9BACT|nr:biotin/lipoyl-binding protein [Neorhodopirellula pilleata]TWU01377.1 Peptidase family M50 [Neorhodopirellula pilleata]
MSSLGDNAAAVPGLPELMPLRRGLCLHHRRESTQVVLEDNVRSKFYRLGAVEALFIQNLIENGSTAHAFSNASQVDASFTIENAVGLCKWLAINELTAANSANGGTTPDRPAKGASTPNPFALAFFWKIPIVNPDQWLQTLVRYFGWLFCSQALLLGLACFLLGVLQTSGNWAEFSNSYENLFTPWRGLTLALAWLVLKVIHETAHGATCRRYGGEVNEAGFAMILLMPIAYVNVTSSWRFASRWQRLHVTLAGVAAELFIAGLALIAWNLCDSLPLKQAATDVVLLATVSSLLFNLNPLLKFDGYFALADATGIDNLYSFGQRYAQYFGNRYILGLDAEVPTLPGSRPAWIKLYGLSAAVYRVFTISGLLIAAAALFKGAGIAIAIAGGFSFIVRPLWTLANHLWKLHGESELSLARLAVRLGLLVSLVFGAMWFAPVSFTWTAPAIVQYDPPAVLRSRSAGFIAALHARDGQPVVEGQTIVTLRNDELELELAGLRKELAQTDQEILAAQWNADSSKLGDAQSRRAGLVEQVEELQIQVDSMAIRAPNSGTLVARNLHLLLETYVEAGQELAVVGREDSKRLKVSIAQIDVKQAAEWINHPLRIVVDDAPSITASFSRIETRADDSSPDDSLLATNGGSLPAVPSAEGAVHLMEPRVNAYIRLTAAQALQLRSGKRAYVSIGNSQQTLGGIIYQHCFDFIDSF